MDAGGFQGVREEVEALRDCLVRSGVLRLEQYLAAVHRRRFAAARRAHPFGPGRGLPDALEAGGLAERLCLQYPLREASALAATSRACVPLAQAITAWQAGQRALVCVCGGVDEEDSLISAERFDPERHLWEALPPMGSERWGASAAAMGGRLYTCGGCNTQDDNLSSVERFDPERNLWEALPPMSSERFRSSAAAMDGRLYVFGGLNAEEEILSSAERFDPERNIWEALLPMGAERKGAAAAAMGGRLYVFGGSNAQDYSLSSAERFDPERNLWEALPPMGSERAGASAAAMRGSLYIFGGFRSSDARRAEAVTLSSAERFDPERNLWEVLPPMGSERWGSAAAAMGGSLYVLGGSGSGGSNAQFWGSAERFDPENNLWEALPPMGSRRGEAACAVIRWLLPVLGASARTGEPGELLRILRWD